MPTTSRTSYLLRNIGAGFTSQLIGYLISFAYQTVFIYCLGQTYLGIAGLFSNVLSILALAELGIGAAIGFSLYEPIAKGDKDKVSALLQFYKKAYYIIGFVIGFLGLSLVPFLNFFVASPPDVKHFTFIYVLYVLNSALSYFFIHKQSVLYAEQRGYIVTIYVNIFTTLRTILQIVYLLVCRDFIGTLLLQVGMTLLTNVILSFKVDKIHPYLRNNKAKLKKEEKKKLFSKISAMFCHQIGSIVVLGTDNLLISKYIGLTTVGVYSNYYLLIGLIRKITSHVTTSLVAGIGNMVSLEITEKTKGIFDILNFFNYWISSFCAICFITLLNPFIFVWIGETYLFDTSIVIAIVASYYLGQMRQIVLSYRNALGLFQQDKYKPLFESAINLITSIILLREYGTIGVFIGTIISTVSTSMWVEPYILFRYYFKTGLFRFWRQYIFRTCVTIVIAFLMVNISHFVFDGSFLSLVILFLLCAVIPNILMCLVFFSTKEFKEGFYRLRNIICPFL